MDTQLAQNYGKMEGTTGALLLGLVAIAIVAAALLQPQTKR